MEGETRIEYQFRRLDFIVDKLLNQVFEISDFVHGICSGMKISGARSAGYLFCQP